MERTGPLALRISSRSLRWTCGFVFILPIVFAYGFKPSHKVCRFRVSGLEGMGSCRVAPRRNSHSWNPAHRTSSARSNNKKIMVIFLQVVLRTLVAAAVVVIDQYCRLFRCRCRHCHNPAVTPIAKTGFTTSENILVLH